MDFSALRPVLEYGVALVVAAVVTAFAYRILREYIDDIKKQRDKAVESAAAGAVSIDRLTEKHGDRFDAIDRRLEAIERKVDR